MYKDDRDDKDDKDESHISYQSATFRFFALFLPPSFMRRSVQSHTLLVRVWVVSSCFWWSFVFCLLPSSSHDGKIFEKLFNVMPGLGRDLHEGES